MHNIKLIRGKPDFFLKKLSHRNIDINIKSILDLDKKNRELIQSKEKLEQEKKIISKKQDKSQFLRSKKISKEIEQFDKSQIKIKDEIETTLSSLPNLALDDVPIGKDASSNKEIKKIGEIPQFKFQPISHYEIGKKLNLMDFDVAAKTSGARFVFLKDKLALLERAISNFMIYFHTNDFL
jgi:seryl-tRNA synthetase